MRRVVVKFVTLFLVGRVRIINYGGSGRLDRLPECKPTPTDTETAPEPLNLYF